MKVKLEDRFNYHIPTNGPLAGCTLIIDTSEFTLLNNNAVFYSGYKKANTLKYEGAVQISIGKFHWAPTPGQPGPTSDQVVFRLNGLAEKLENGELIIGDGKYITLPHCLEHTFENEEARIKVRQIVENAWGRLKEKFHCMWLPWRHDVTKHHVAFKVCINLTNIIFDFNPLRKNIDNFLL